MIRAVSLALLVLAASPGAFAQETPDVPLPPGIGSNLLDGAGHPPAPDGTTITPEAAEPPGPETPAPVDERPAPVPASDIDPAPPERDADKAFTPGPLPPAPAPASSDPGSAHSVRALLRGLWRADVAEGLTDLGFDVWLAGEIGSEAPAPATPDTQPDRIRAVSERWESRTGPVALGQAGRVVTTFGAAIPTAFCAPLTVCYIELEPGEVLTDTPSWGDTARWQVVAKVQGRDPETVVLEIKPAGDAETTNLVIPTDRRLYSITLVNDAEVHTPILAFRYPGSEARAIAAGIAARKEAEAAAERRRAQATAATAAARAATLERSGVETSTGARAAGDLDFAFRITGEARFRPVRVFADGTRTYIDLHPRYRGMLPAILPGPGEANKALNTRVSEGGTRLVADRVITDIWLQAGRERVRIRKAGP